MGAGFLPKVDGFRHTGLLLALYETASVWEGLPASKSVRH